MIEAADRALGADRYPAGVIDDDGPGLYDRSPAEGDAIAQLNTGLGTDQATIAQKEIDRFDQSGDEVALGQPGYRTETTDRLLRCADGSASRREVAESDNAG